MSPTTTKPRPKSPRKRIAKKISEIPEAHKILDFFQTFEGKTLGEAWNLFTEGAPCHKSFKDVPDPGPKVKVGEQGHVELEELGALERIIQPENNLLPVHFLEEGTMVQKAVARIALKESHAGLPVGSGWGTGFLVSPGLLMTNNHVIPTTSFARKVEAQFNYQFDHQGNALQVDKFSFDPDDVFYTNASLDFTLLRVGSKPIQRYMTTTEGVEAMPERWRFPDTTQMEATDYMAMPDDMTFVDPTALPSVRARTTMRYPGTMMRLTRPPGYWWGHLRLPAGTVNFAQNQHLNIVQHPQGRRKEVAVQENHTDAIYSNVVRYLTDTEPGSSGSPVFNNAWDLMVIHHAGGEYSDGQWRNNEGIRMDRIVDDLRTHFQGTTTGQAILNELGL